MTQEQSIQGEPKNVVARKSRYPQNARIFLYQILLIRLADSCAKVC